QVTPLHGGRDLGNVAHLGGEVGGQLVDVIGQVLPRAGGAQHVGLTAQPALSTDFTRHPGHLAGKGVELIDHAVDRVHQVVDLAPDVDGDLFRQVALG